MDPPEKLTPPRWCANCSKARPRQLEPPPAGVFTAGDRPANGFEYLLKHEMLLAQLSAQALTFNRQSSSSKMRQHIKVIHSKFIKESG